MYVSFDNNEYHHLTIQEIKDHTNNEVPYLALYCTGKTLRRDVTTANGYRVTPYRITVMCYKGLIDYVYSELSVKDNIFVIGYSTTIKYNKYYMQRNMIAQCLYREDWMNYFKDVNPKDLTI